MPSLGQSRPRCWQGMARPRQHGRAAGHGRGLQSSQALAKSIKPVVDVLVTFSRDDGTRLDKRQQDSYFRNALDFLNARYGAENVLCAAIHRDETTSHLQVLIAARHEGGRLSARS